MIILKSPQEIAKMKDPCRMVAEVLELLKDMVRPGITTLALNAAAEKEALKYRAKPAFKGYSGYPYSLCCSVNDQVVHGMPDNRELRAGDILSLDFGVLYNGYYGDAAVTFPVGEISATARKLLKVTEESLYAAIDVATPSNRLSDISYAVQSHVESHGFSVVRDFVGHGIGTSLHESPQVPNFGSPGRGITLKPGMVLAIEPMVNEKGPDVKVLGDGWTAVTCDGGLSAHFEHTVAITDHGSEILTKL
ncbi:MAG TPA: type I methionyl aminopeptidase [Geobacteraceae bacterium]|nr:type I methionyl aminopeptidase [Geobacteraceae bacterium]